MDGSTGGARRRGFCRRAAGVPDVARPSPGKLMHVCRNVGRGATKEHGAKSRAVIEWPTCRRRVVRAVGRAALSSPRSPAAPRAVMPLPSRLLRPREGKPARTKRGRASAVRAGGVAGLHIDGRAARIVARGKYSRGRAAGSRSRTEPAECRGAFQPCDFGGRELFASEGQKKIILNIRRNGSARMHALAFSLTIVL